MSKTFKSSPGYLPNLHHLCHLRNLYSLGSLLLCLCSMVVLLPLAGCGQKEPTVHVTVLPNLEEELVLYMSAKAQKVQIQSIVLSGGSCSTTHVKDLEFWRSGKRPVEYGPDQMGTGMSSGNIFSRDFESTDAVGINPSDVVLYYQLPMVLSPHETVDAVLSCQGLEQATVQTDQGVYTFDFDLKPTVKDVPLAATLPEVNLNTPRAQSTTQAIPVSTQPGSPLIAQLFIPEMIGVDRAYLEQFTGAARQTQKDVIDPDLIKKTYKVDNCDIDIIFGADVVVSLGINLSERCTFDLAPFIQEQKSIAAHQLTFGVFDQETSQTSRYYADCLGNCGNAYDPAVYDHFSGSRALQFLEIMVSSTRMNDTYSWERTMRADMGDAWVEDRQYNCEPERYTPKARELFANENIQRIEIGRGLLENHYLLNDCNKTLPEEQAHIQYPYRVDIGAHGEFSLTSYQDNLKIDNVLVNGFDCNVYDAETNKEIGGKRITLPQNQTIKLKVNITEDCAWPHTVAIEVDGDWLDGEQVDPYQDFVQSLDLALGEPMAIVVAVTDSQDGDVNIRTQPDAKSSLVMRVPNNTVFEVKGHEGNWLEVTSIADNQVSGYVHNSQVYVRPYHRP